MDIWNKKAKLAHKVKEDLLTRSKQGVWAHPLCVVLVLTTTDLRHRVPVLSSAFVLCLMGLCALRLALFQFFPGDAGLSKRVYRLHTVLMVLSTATWGWTSGLALWQIGFSDEGVTILLLYHAAIAFATGNLVVHNLRLIGLLEATLFVPAIVGNFLHHGYSPWPYFAASMACLLYCFVQGKKMNRLYAQQISDNYELSIAAYQDCLTGIPNRLYMNQALDTCFETAHAKGRHIALMYIDLDGFKQINDRYSHKVGDLFLCEAARRIQAGVRPTDIAARIGGDEFTILLPECASEDEAISLADRVLADTREPVRVGDHLLKYSASIGVSFFPAIASSQEELIRAADEAMYVAKKCGKGRICIAPSKSLPETGFPALSASYA